MPYKDPQKQKEWNRRYNASPPGKMAKRKRQQKYAAKARASLLESRRLAAEALGMTAPLDEAEVQTKAQELAHTKGILGGGERRDLHHLMRDPSFSVYVGTTGQELEKEAFKFLYFRGGPRVTRRTRNKKYMSDHKLCRPPLVNAATGKTLGAKKFKKLFMCKTIYTTIHHADVTRVEAELQRLFQHRGLGRRLWRQVGAGAKGWGGPLSHVTTYKVFLTWGFGVLSDPDVQLNP